MSEEIRLEIDKKSLETLFRKLSASTRSRTIKGPMNLYGQDLVSFSQKERFRTSGFSSKTTHPTILTSRSGRLRSSINATKTEQSGNEYSFKFGTNVKYGAIHEFGGTIRQGARSEIFLRPRYVRGSKKGMFKKIRGKRAMGRGLSFVESVRTIPPRPFLHPAVNDTETRQKFLNNLIENIKLAVREA